MQDLSCIVTRIGTGQENISSSHFARLSSALHRDLLAKGLDLFWCKGCGDQRCPDGTWSHPINADASVHEPLGQGSRESYNSALCARVVQELGGPTVSSDRRGVDDCATWLHMLDSILRCINLTENF